MSVSISRHFRSCVRDEKNHGRFVTLGITLLAGRGGIEREGQCRESEAGVEGRIGAVVTPFLMSPRGTGICADEPNHLTSAGCAHDLPLALQYPTAAHSLCQGKTGQIRSGRDREA